MIRLRLLSCALSALILLTTLDAAERPNIVVIMADDMGFSDIGCYGGEIDTPNLDRLAKNGLRFRQFYNTARCCPTRASLMTGLYPHQAGMGWMTVRDLERPGYRGALNRSCATIAEILRTAGYGTYLSGKWHLVLDKNWDGPKHNWPLQRGFDRFFGTINGAGSFWTPATLTRDNERIEAPKEGFFYTDAINDHAVTFIEDHLKATPKRPFFVYVSHTAPHWPLHAHEEDIAKYRGKYQKGWDKLRRERRERMIELGLIEKRWAMTKRDSTANTGNPGDATRRDDMDLRMATYAAQIDRMDVGIGRIVACLERSKQLDNTLVLFLADNGGCAEGGLWGFDRKPEKGVIGEDSSFSSYGLSWANASNTPFREYKHWVHEGGIASPLVAHWPAGISAKGEFRDHPSHVIDIAATCYDLAGVEYPKTFADQKIAPIEGKSLRPAFANRPIEREAIYWEHEANRAVRQGRWKLVAKGIDGPWELYDLQEDRTETNDLAVARPELRKKLEALWNAYAERTLVLPLDGRGWGDRVENGPLTEAQLESEFELRADAKLPTEKSPHVAGRAFEFSAVFDAKGKDGVLVAQGGLKHGYALYVRKGKIEVAFRRGGRLTVIESAKPVPAGSTRATCRLFHDGRIEITAGKETVRGRLRGGLLASHPIDGLDVGRDDGGAVGRYEVPGAFGGEIEKVEVKIGITR